MNRYESTWEDYLTNNYFPVYVRNIKEVTFDYLRDCVLNNQSKTEEMIADFLDGDVFIIKHVLDKCVAREIKEDVYKYGNTTPQQYLKADSFRTPNFHCSSLENQTRDGYNEHAHSYFFWRWNPDDLKIFERIDEYWGVIKILNGLGEDGLKNNTPEDKVIDRVQILNYPINTGKITSHCDVARWQKTNVAISLTEAGLDYESGGLYCLDKNEQEVKIEHRVQIGDSILWLPSVFHGVHTPKAQTIDKQYSSRGRWQLVAQAVQSWRIKNRVVSVSYDNFKKNPEKVMDDYIFRSD